MIKINDITPTNFKEQLYRDIARFEQGSAAKLAEPQFYIAKINDILKDNEQSISTVWEKLKKLVETMPGRFAFWSNVRSLTALIKVTLEKFPKDRLVVAEYHHLQEQLLSNEDKISGLKNTIALLERSYQELQDKAAQLKKMVTPEVKKLHAIQIQQDALQKLYQEKLIELKALMEENAILNKEGEELRKKLHDLEIKYETLQQDYQESIKNRKALETENFRIQEQLSQLEQHYASLPIKTQDDLDQYVERILNQAEKNTLPIMAEKKSPLDYDDVEALLSHDTKDHLSKEKVVQLVLIYKTLSQQHSCNIEENYLHSKIKSEYHENLTWLLYTLSENHSWEKIMLFFSENHLNSFRLLCSLYWVNTMNLASDLASTYFLLEQVFHDLPQKKDCIEVNKSGIEVIRIKAILHEIQIIYEDIKSKTEGESDLDFIDSRNTLSL